MREVVALFIDPRGPYPMLLGKEHCWDERKDARLFGGDAGVVAHPPCQRWGALGRANWARWGGEHNRPGNDGGCFKAALDAVRRCGGVLEHPAGSMAFGAYGIAKPAVPGWNHIGGEEWVSEVWQSAYGHRAQKRTWLFYCGQTKPEEALWAREPGTHQVGYQDKRGKARNKPTLSSREAAESPRAFAEYLIRLAAQSRIGG